jgi:hypothetical protein
VLQWQGAIFGILDDEIITIFYYYDFTAVGLLNKKQHSDVINVIDVLVVPMTVH